MKRAASVLLIANLMGVLAATSATAETSEKAKKSDSSAQAVVSNGKIRLKLKSTKTPDEKAASVAEEPPPGSLPENNSGLEEPTTGFIPDETARPSRRIFTVLNYPQFDGTILYTPSFTGFKQVTPVKVNGAFQDFGYELSGYSLVNVTAALGAKFSARSMARLRMNYFIFATKEIAGATSSDPSIGQSQTSIFTPNMEYQYCFFIGDGKKKICPGLGLGIDSFLVLEYATNTSFRLSTITDTMLGPYVEYEAPIIPTLMGRVSIGYEFGLKSGSNTPKTISSDSKIAAKFAVEYPYKDKMTLLTTFDVDYRNAEYTTSAPTSSNQDKFKSTSTTYSLGFGARHEF